VTAFSFGDFCKRLHKIAERLQGFAGRQPKEEQTMSHEQRLRLEAMERYRALRWRAQLAALWGRLRGRRSRLLRLEELTHAGKSRQRYDAGMQQAPIRCIVGSVGRAQDFTPGFLPRAGADGERWIRLYTALHSSAGFPEVELLQVDDHYVVVDGHHRISVARAAGLTHISAHVVQVVTPRSMARIFDVCTSVRQCAAKGVLPASVRAECVCL
jgi:hypothetical protein